MIRKKANKQKRILQQKRKKLLEQEHEENRRKKLFANNFAKDTSLSYTPKCTRYVRETGNELIPSKPLLPPKIRDANPKYEGEMLKRDQVAQKEIERRKKMCVPLYSKGPVQFIGTDADPEIVKNLGKKV